MIGQTSSQKVSIRPFSKTAESVQVDKHLISKLKLNLGWLGFRFIDH